MAQANDKITDKKGSQKALVIYAIALALLVTILKILEAQYFIKDLSLEFYIGAIAVLFTVFGVWIGLKIVKNKQPKVIIKEAVSYSTDSTAMEMVSLSPRELEVLQLMAEGLSNQEIADKLFVSLPTIKSHTSNLFSKLDVKRRTQAIQKAKELRVI